MFNPNLPDDRQDADYSPDDYDYPMIKIQVILPDNTIGYTKEYANTDSIEQCLPEIDEFLEAWYDRQREYADDVKEEIILDDDMEVK
jgi:hypothetical protein